jgi:hypothetical protein
MKVLFTMRESLADDNLLGLALKGPSWDKWKILLIAAAGEELTEDERVIYKELTGRDREPGRLVEVMLIIAGRRSGKSKAMSVFSLWLACCCDWSEDLSIGERGRALFVAPRMEQASVIDEYVRSIIEHVELLQSLIDQQTVRSVRLKRKISFEIHPSNAAHVRGMTAISIVLDECAWLPSGDAVNSAEDLMTALQPSLLTTQGPLLLTSSPAASSGLVYEIFRRHYGPDGDPGCIVVQTDTRTLNPKAKQSVIDKAYASDPEAASAEYGGEFRVPISNYLSREVVDRCIDKGVQERSPLPQVSYLAYVDCASGEGKDSMACVVGHKSRDRDRDIVVIDEIIEARPPFNLHDAIEHLAVHLRKWGINSVMGDRYGKPLITFFAKAGLTYLTTPIDTSDVYLHCLPQWTSKSVLMLDRHPRAID